MHLLAPETHDKGNRFECSKEKRGEIPLDPLAGVNTETEKRNMTCNNKPI